MTLADLDLGEDQRAFQETARGFADDCLVPHEVEAELNGGQLPPAIAARHEKRALEIGFSRMDVPREYGGLALSIEAQVAAWEQLGRVTNALAWCFAEPQRWIEVTAPPRATSTSSS